ncbi:endonuclease/exonuclease/phosphatase family protein [Profundibacter amoris]|uniref:endonuclease/exonuclease/phosphatase family protein n=1 Tax=Profundibacter amoris TaxID=2171755 RepID=UPI0026BABDAE|nr:endonuclease/exonuclease/phosphatase family protein [Profundibacter amoris]
MSPVLADTYRIATYNAELQRRGPGLLLRDIQSGKDKQVLAVADVIRRVSPDVLLLNRFDYDAGGVALAAFADLLNDYPYRFALRPNTGMQTGLDMDGDGRVGGPRDGQGYGRFAGQGGMAILSRYPLDAEHVQDFSALKWAAFPDALLPMVDGKPFPSPQALAAQRLSSVGHWVVPVKLPDGVINLMAFHAGPPVFDGPEDRNGKRNHDEVRFWSVYLDGGLDTPPASGPFVILGDANQDPLDGEGLKDAIRGLLAHPLVQDPLPQSEGAVVAAREQGGVNASHQTDPTLDTVDWKDTPAPGNMRVDYVLPSKDLQVAGAGVYWPVGDADGSRHHLVWVDVEMVKKR